MRRHVFALAPLLLLAACGEKQPRPAAAQPAAPVKVPAISAAAEPWPEMYEATGTVRARTAAVVSSKVMGYVREAAFQIGDRVRAGQLLVTIDARDLETGVQRAEAGMQEVSSAIPEADNGIAAAKANLDLSEVTFRRMQELANKKSISSQEFDEATAKVQAARAAYQMARSRREQLNARMAQAGEERRAAQIARDYARIHAPFAGVITAKSVEPGNLAAPGAPLATVEREGGYRLEANVDESKLPAIKLGQTVQVMIDALGRNVEGRVSEIVPAVDAASRAYTVKIDLPSMPALRSGIFGRAAFAMGTRDALALPQEAVMDRGQLRSIMVVENGAAHMRLVSTGRKAAGRVEILSGLTAGEKVVTPAVPGLSDGAPVEVRP